MNQLLAPPSDRYLVIGGRGPAALRATLRTLTVSPERILCAVPASEESVVSHAASAVVLEPWPGPEGALDRLAESIDPDTEDMVQVLLAGDRALRTLSTWADRADVMIPVDRDWGVSRWAGAVGSRRIRLEPGGGMMIRGGAFSLLRQRGWFRGTTITVGEMQDLVGQVVLAPIDRVIDEIETESIGTRVSRLTLTAIVPAHNEAAFIGDTIRGLRAQVRKPDQIIVVDDGSSDGTADVAAALGATVLRTGGTGSKGRAINAALEHVTTDAIFILDADTDLHPDALMHLMAALEAGADATHGSVMPAQKKGLWVRGRTIEYAAAQRITKAAQKTLGRMVVMSGCVMALRMDAIRAVGGFQDRTMVEDLDLTWALHLKGFKVEFTRRAVAYPVEPANFSQYRAQMRRWSRGYFQTIAAYRRSLHRMPGLGLIVAASLFDLLVTPVAIVLVFAAAFAQPLAGSWMATGVVLGALWLALSALAAVSVIGVRSTVRCFPAFVITNLTGTYFYLEAFVVEWIFRRRLNAWVKGH